MSIQLSIGANNLTLPNPSWGYKTLVTMPFDIVLESRNKHSVFDNGVNYDKRECRATFYLDATQYNYLETYLNIYSRGAAFTLTLPSGNGFFPFGPDAGDEGVFTVSANVTNKPKADEYKMFSVDFSFVNTGDYPLVSFVNEVSQGQFSFGAISGLQTPQELFAPTELLSYASVVSQGNVLYAVDRGSGDNATTQFDINTNLSKAQALLNYITKQVRSNTFTLSTPESLYIFGSYFDGVSSQTVRLITDRVVVTHNNVNDFDFYLEVARA